MPRPLVLIILDGWGYREDPTYNAIAHAHKPCWDKLWAERPHMLLSGSGHCVGLPAGQMGNSEVGHLTMGAGRVIYQDLTKIDRAIADKTFFSNPILNKALRQTQENKKALHILGLLSQGGVHSHENHIHALLQLAAEYALPYVYVHAFLDGRDTPPRSAKSALASLAQYCEKQQHGQIASIVGRYYAMDRDQRFERTQKAYDLLVQGEGLFSASDPLQGLEMAYARGENDEFVKPTVINKSGKPTKIEDGDTVICMNFRADRARQLTTALAEPNFAGFKRKKHPNIQIYTLTEYDPRLPVTVILPKEPLKNILGEYISQHKLPQLRMAETEKYAHVTFFFNGGIEKPYPGETRILIPSPKVATYDLLPAMSAEKLTDALVKAIISQDYALIICNFANPDMVGHTGNFPATVEAIEYIDHCLSRIISALEEVNAEALITADHGNAEIMFNPETNQAHTAHTEELVPLLYVGRKAHFIKEKGNLADIAPTILALLTLPIPVEMSGEVLLHLD